MVTQRQHQKVMDMLYKGMTNTQIREGIPTLTIGQIAGIRARDFRRPAKPDALLSASNQRNASGQFTGSKAIE